MSKEKKILLITGASSDIGISLISEIGDNYNTIIAHFHSNDERLLKLQKDIMAEIIPVQADFLKIEEVEKIVEFIFEQNLYPDHIVHLPALPLRNIQFSKTVWDDYEMEINTSFRSAVMLSQAFITKMAKQKYGKIIFMLSLYVINQPTIKYAIPYTTGKYALLGLLKGLSAEYAHKGITVNGISPSMVETKFLSTVPQLIIEKNAAESPLKRNLIVEDLLPTFTYLLSDGADCVTGQNISVTGGN